MSDSDGFEVQLQKLLDMVTLIDADSDNVNTAAMTYIKSIPVEGKAMRGGGSTDTLYGPLDDIVSDRLWTFINILSSLQENLARASKALTAIHDRYEEADHKSAADIRAVRPERVTQ